MSDRRTATILGRLYSTADAGHHGLPAQMLEARSRLQALDAAVAELQPPLGERTALDAAIASAVLDPTVDVAGPVLDARRADETLHLRAAVLRGARDVAADGLEHTGLDLAELVVTDHLRPALAEVVSQVGGQVRVFSPFGIDADALLTAPAKARTAWQQFCAAADRYDALRLAHGAVLDLTGRSEHDDHAVFGSIRNAADVWPELRTSRQPVAHLVRPWPQQTRPFLLWCVENHAELWLPLADEQERAWLGCFGERVRERQQNARVLTQYRQLADDIVSA